MEIHVKSRRNQYKVSISHGKRFKDQQGQDHFNWRNGSAGRKSGHFAFYWGWSVWDSKGQSEVDLACTLTVGFGDRDWELKQASGINPHVVFLHAVITDRLDLRGIESWLKDIRNLGLGCGHGFGRCRPPLYCTIYSNRRAGFGFDLPPRDETASLPCHIPLS
jgi:hypothetical protein